jgi:hypothetical protein
MDPDDDLTYADLAEYESGGSSEGERSSVGYRVDEGAPQSPPDRPVAVEDTATTVEGQRRGASLDERLAEEEPERVSRAGSDEQGEVVESGGEQGPDVESESVGELEPTHGPLGAEDAAMHIEDDDASRLGLTDHDDDYVT